VFSTDKPVIFKNNVVILMKWIWSSKYHIVKCTSWFLADMGHHTILIKGLHKSVHRDEQAQGLWAEATKIAHIPFTFVCLCDALLHVNLLYSDSYVKSFYSTWGRRRLWGKISAQAECKKINPPPPPPPLHLQNKQQLFTKR
jgi:hypothetical protein